MNAASAILDRTTAVPLHYQVSRYLRSEIGRGRYRPGDLLPPETTIAEELQLSRATVRQGIATLVAEGLLSRRRGVGTVVAGRDFEQPLRGLYTFAGTAAESGRTLTTSVLLARVNPASREAAQRLGLRADADAVLELERLRLVDGVPLVLEFVVLPAAPCAALLPLDGNRDLALPLYELLEQRCGLTVTGAREQIRPVNLGRREAGLLVQEPGMAAFRVDRTGLAGDTAIEWRVSLIRGDRYLYSIELSRELSRSAGLPAR